MIAKPRETDWIMTASGRPFWPLEPHVDDVAIDDIAHHLSNLCRFTGAVRAFYSVAQHSVLVSMAMATAGPVASLYGLLHDASEAYLMDLPRPLKHDPHLVAYRRAEGLLQGVIYRAFDLDPDGEPIELKTIDRRLLRAEQRDLMPPPALQERRDDVEPYPARIDPWGPHQARTAFLWRFSNLMARRRLEGVAVQR